MIDLRQFKSRMLTPQLANRFHVTLFSPIDGGETMHLVSERCTFPQYGYDKLITSYRYGTGVKDTIPGASEFKELGIDFIMEAGGKEFEYIWEWFKKAVHPFPIGDNEGEGTPSETPYFHDKITYTQSYKDDYAGTITLQLHNESGQTDKEPKFVFHTAYPINFQGTELTWKSEEYAKVTVNFTYYAMKYIPGTRLEPYEKPLLAAPTAPSLEGSLAGPPDLLGGDSIFLPQRFRTPPNI